MTGKGTERRRIFGDGFLLVLTMLLLLGGIYWGFDVLQAEDEGITAVSSPLSPSLADTASPSDSTTVIVDSDRAETAVNINTLPIISDNSLAPAPNPRTYQAKLPAHAFETYVVQAGDTPNIIADKHDISAETLLGGNPWMSQESNQLQAGAELVILPIDGVLHTVKPGESIDSVAELYDVSTQSIIDYAPNNLEYPYYRVYPDMQLLVPGAKIGRFYWTAPKSVAGSGGQQDWKVIGTGTFVWPVTGRCVTTYFWYGHPGLDVGLTEGSSVVAADRGTVTYASWASGTYYDYGNLIVINHGNGYETFYAHLSSINVYAGQTVEQGEFIGLTGNTGRSSGPHIHVEIRLNDIHVNPLNLLGGATQNCTGS